MCVANKKKRDHFILSPNLPNHQGMCAGIPDPLGPHPARTNWRVSKSPEENSQEKCPACWSGLNRHQEFCISCLHDKSCSLVGIGRVCWSWEVSALCFVRRRECKVTRYAQCHIHLKPASFSNTIVKIKSSQSCLCVHVIERQKWIECPS